MFEHDPFVIQTRRLRLLAATEQHVRAELESRSAFGALIDAHIPDSWPPGQYDREAQEFFLQSLTAGGAAAVGWFGWYALYSAHGMDRATLIGSGGYLGPPAQDGTVEIGYSVCPEWRGLGFATEMATAFAQHAMQLPTVHRVVAHTHDSNAGSVAVLRNGGFALVNPSDQPDTLLFQWTGASRATNENDHTPFKP